MSIRKSAAAAAQAPGEPGETPPVRQKLITCMQSTGRAGKSTFGEALLHWLDYAGVDYGGVDSDAQHRTLSSRHPRIPFYNATADKNRFASFIESMPGDKPVLFADFPAQATDFLLEAWETFNVSAVLEARGSRPVNVIFAADDETAIVSAIQIFEYFGCERSDWVIVKNPARADWKSFERIKLYRTLREAGAPEITLPAITADTVTAVADLSVKHERYLSLSEAAASPELSLLRRFELEHFLNVAMTQMEDAAEVLLPSPELIRRKVFRAEKGASSASSASSGGETAKPNPFKRY